MQDADLVDRLAEWCKLGEQGYERIKCHPCNTRWLKTEGCLTVEWRPLDSDDDCRVVMEECRERGMLLNVACAMEPPWREAPDDNSVFMAWLLLASPREKCLAVAKVLGWE